MRSKALLLLILLAGAACAQEPSEVVNAISRSVCRGASDNKACNFPANFSKDFYGVCCKGECNFGARSCDEYGRDYDVYDIFQRFTCRNVPEDGACRIPESIRKELGGRIKGSCCSRLCRVGVESCSDYCGNGICTDQERKSGTCSEDCGGGGYREYCGNEVCESGERSMGNCPQDCGGTDSFSGGDRPSGMSFEEQLKELEVLACLGIEEGVKCTLPKDLEKQMGLTGVCCSGRCNYRKSYCNKTTQEAVPLPDLVVTKVEVTPAEPTEKDSINITATIENSGNATTGRNFWIEAVIYEDGRIIKSEAFESNRTLGRGESMSHTFTHLIDLGRPASVRISVLADENSNLKHYSNLIKESDEGNNEGARVLYVKQAVVKEERYCGDGLCEDIEEGSCTLDCRVVREESPQPRDFIMIIAALFLLLILSIVFFGFRSRGKKTVAEPHARRGETLEDLLKQKAEIDEMTAMAKAKYHRRELDEESFREIVRDNQVKIMQLELKIKELQGEKSG